MMIEGEAIISECGQYRYCLRRTWDDRFPSVLFIMLNPSTADADTNDPTIRALIRWAQTHNYGSLEVVNMFAYRATNPKHLNQVDDPHGPLNDIYLMNKIETHRTIILGFGNGFEDRQKYILTLIEIYGKIPFCLGINKNGTPKHPLYIKTDTDLMEYRPNVSHN